MAKKLIVTIKDKTQELKVSKQEETVTQNVGVSTKLMAELLSESANLLAKSDKMSGNDDELISVTINLSIPKKKAKGYSTWKAILSAEKEDVILGG